MVAITPLTAIGSLQVHTGGSAAHQSASVNANGAPEADAPATIVTLSDHAQMLVAEAKAAQLAADLFAIANGVAARGEGDAPQSAKTQIVVAHDVQANEGLYIVWSSVR